METSWTLTVNLMNVYSPINAQQTIFSFCHLVAPIVTLLIPYYNNLMIKNRISPLAGYSVINIIGFLSLFWLNKLDKNEL